MVLRFIAIVIITRICIAGVLGIVGGGPVSLIRAYVRVCVHNWLCGGTLVDHDKVLTAAHCLFGDDQKPVSVSEIKVVKGNFVKKDWYKSATRIACERYIVHESYDTFLSYEFNPYNIALIELQESVDLSQDGNKILRPCTRQQLGSLTFAPPDVGYAVGMGLIQLYPHYNSDVLKGLRLFHNSICTSMYRSGNPRFYNLHVDPINHVCYDSRKLTGCTCMGDSGGPIVHKDENDDVICLIGIDIYGDVACDPQIPNVFIRASAFRDWINEGIITLSTYLTFDAEKMKKQKPIRKVIF